jgi:hypothetical protein
VLGALARRWEEATISGLTVTILLA